MNKNKIIELVRKGLDISEQLAVDAYKNNLDSDRITILTRENLDDLLSEEGYSFSEVLDSFRSGFEEEEIDSEIFELLAFLDSLE